MTQLLLAPPPSHTTTSTTLTTKTTSSHSAPSAPGVHDTLRSSLSHPSSNPASILTPHPSSSSEVLSSHPLESRLRHWRSTQHSLHQTLARRTYGIAAPVIRDMELVACRLGEFDRPGVLGGIGGGTGGLHADVLGGTDWEVGGWEGVYGGDSWGGGDDFAGEAEGRRGLWGW
ncbi:MAG: hypothetical protein M1828_005303 [Chrysothrix sp. TS-e1954]|nr:MAG: hypothetical protein M1828_005303 [Chrysothrix sp. TS-e1954]